MNLAKMKSLDDLSAFFDDPFDEIMNGDSKKKKKKKKKKHDDGDVSYKDSLKEMSKKELRAQVEKMGIELSFLDMEDKKAMRKAILKARSNSERKQPSEIKMVKPKGEPVGLQIAASENTPPYFFDEDTRNFIIRDADDAPDMTCYKAMQSLGRIRRRKRSDDGFSGLMDRLDQLIQKGIMDEAPKKLDGKDIIDVDYVDVKDEKTPKAVGDGQAND